MAHISYFLKIVHIYLSFQFYGKMEIDGQLKQAAQQSQGSQSWGKAGTNARAGQHH